MALETRVNCRERIRHKLSRFSFEIEVVISKECIRLLMSSTWEKRFLDNGKDDYITQLSAINAAVLLSFRHFQLDLMVMYPTQSEHIDCTLAQIPHQHPGPLCRFGKVPGFPYQMLSNFNFISPARSSIFPSPFIIIFKHSLNLLAFYENLDIKASFIFPMIMSSLRDNILAPPL